MGFSLNDPAILEALKRGLIRAVDLGGPSAPVPPPSAEPSPAPVVPELVAPSFTAPGCWTIPVVTVSETNARGWKARSNRTKAARAAVSRAFGAHLDALAVFGAHYHRGGALKVAFTRLGGRRLDPSNLPAALKAVEDAVALMLGADDGDSRWRSEFHQESSALMGVRVELVAV